MKNSISVSSLSYLCSFCYGTYKKQIGQYCIVSVIFSVSIHVRVMDTDRISGLVRNTIQVKM